MIKETKEERKKRRRKGGREREDLKAKVKAKIIEGRE